LHEAYLDVKPTMQVVRLIVVGSLTAAAILMCSACGEPLNPATPGGVLSGDSQAAMVGRIGGSDDAARLAALWKQRASGPAIHDYVIGPGDVIEITAQDVEELNNRSARVAENGTVNLPLIGTVTLGGHTADQAASEIQSKLTKYLYHPQVQVFVKEYQSRQVAVIGAVQKPGIVTLTRSNPTIMDMITRAGGMTGDAGDQIVLFPAEKDSNTGAFQSVSFASESAAQNVLKGAPLGRSDNAQGDSGDVSGLVRKLSAKVQPVIIPLKGRSMGADRLYLDMPVRPGDVIVVPGGGKVMVTGWIETPGQIQVGPGLTVLGAIGAAGGPMYAADMSDIQLVRATASGHKQIISLNLTNIINGQSVDPPVIANDIINVPYSAAKIGPYVIYSIVSRMGIMGPGIPAF
jgi:polysaccharide export outer membrane protein